MNEISGVNYYILSQVSISREDTVTPALEKYG